MGVYMRKFFNILFRFLPFILSLLPFAIVANATETLPGLNYYTYASTGGSPALPSTNAVPLSSGTVSWIAHNWGGGQVLDSGRHDLVIVKYEGWLTAPSAQTYYLCANSDDGFRLYLDDVLVINDWYDRGGGCGQTADVDFSNGQPKQLTAYYYENGGGATSYLTYYTDNGGWAFVPSAWYTQSAPPTTTTTTTQPPLVLNPPTNLQVEDTGVGIHLTWSEPETSNVSVERYAISWSNQQGGWGIATGNVGDQNALNTSIVIPYAVFGSSGGLNIEYSFTVRSDNDTLGIYSSLSEAILFTVNEPPPPTTTTTTTTTTTEPPTTTTEPTTTTTEPEPVITDPPTTTTEPETIPPVVIPPDTEPPVTTEPEVVQPEPTDPPVTEPEITEPPTTEPDPLPEEPQDVNNQIDEILSGDLNQEELVDAATDLLSGELSTEQFTKVIDQVFAAGLTDEAFAEVLETVFDEPLSDEEFSAVIDAVLEQPLSDEQFSELVDVLSGENVTEEQVQEAINAIIETGIDEDQAAEIATSAEILSSITSDQATEIFDTVVAGELTEEQGQAIVDAVQNAPEEVKEAFEEEINVFQGNFDTYVAIGSSIPVGERRVVIAAGAVIAAAPVAGASRRK